MGAVSRTFKLRLSPAGMKVLIAAHCRLIRATRQLLPWGTTLHVALAHLDSLSAPDIVEALARAADARLQGSEVHFLGAPQELNDIASRIVARVLGASPYMPAPTLLQVYIGALFALLSARTGALRSAHDTVVRPKSASPTEC